MSEVFLEKLVNYGVLGVVLVWFMLRAEKLFEKMAASVDANTKAVLKLCGDKEVKIEE